MKSIAILSSILFASSVFAQPQSNCGKTEEVIKYLQEDFKEELVMVSINEDTPDHIVSLWMNKRSGTATIVKSSQKEGRSCMVESMLNAKLVSNI